MTTTSLFGFIKPSMNMSMRRQDVLPDHWKQVAEKDTGLDTKNPHILAARIISRGGPITLDDINSVLLHQNISITLDEFNDLKNITYTTYSLTDLNAIRSSLLGKSWAIYMFVNGITGAFYVGSTINILERLKHYFKDHKGKVRLILEDLRQHRIRQFELRVYDIPKHLQTPALLLALEQYYILCLDPSNNTLKVANGSPGGMRISEQNSLANSTPIAVTMNDVMIYVFNSMNGIKNNAVQGLGATTTTIIKCLNTGDPYLGTFVLTRIMDGKITESPDFMSLEDFKVLVETKRLEYSKTWVRTKPAGRPPSTTPSFTVVRLSDGYEHTFPNFNSARVWLREQTGKHVENKTIASRIASGVPLNGLLYKPNNQS